jgi:hypothetical protein
MAASVSPLALVCEVAAEASPVASTRGAAGITALAPAACGGPAADATGSETRETDEESATDAAADVVVRTNNEEASPLTALA